ncbi:MAG TPA: (Fe-S)-binding protein, partial [Bacteroidales bacterium]|nr:(Fe-S)-binding protein [Bacteroidales bacterium]
MQVSVFIPCFIDQFFPETGFNMIKLLEHVGCTVNYNPNQTCCGQPSFNSGYMKETITLATKFLQDFSGDDIIVSPGGSCTGFIKKQYASLFSEPEHIEQAQKLATRMYDITDFLVHVIQKTQFGA